MSRSNAEVRSGPRIVGSMPSHSEMSEIVTEDELEEIVGDLTECADDALSQAACGGIVDPAEVIAWTEFARRLILYQRDED
ncbi:MAG: hypothetical protein GY733_05585, partial [bacterium]|nr:hypothetical protein [bacterium]